jgi:hypothetical protein
MPLTDLLHKPTTIIPRSEVNSLHELNWTKAIIIYYKAPCKEGMVVVGVGSRKGSKSKIKQYLKTGKIIEI